MQLNKCKKTNKKTTTLDNISSACCNSQISLKKIQSNFACYKSHGTQESISDVKTVTLLGKF